MMTIKRILSWIVFFVLTNSINFVYGSAGIERLVKKLFDQYNPNVRPVMNENKTVNVEIFFGITQLLKLEDVSKTIECICFMELTWQDDFLVWNPEDYDNVTEFRYPHQNVWKPDIILTNTPDLNNGPVMNTASTNVVLVHDGTVTNAFTAVYKITCRDMDMTAFPFDEHVCAMDFASWTYNQAEMDVLNKSYEFELPNSMKLIPNAEWDIAIVGQKKLLEWECCPNETYPTLRIYVQLKRKPLFFLINTIIPTMVTCYICFFGMFCPSTNTGERTEKAFLGITTLLAVSLLMLNVSTLMPVTSTAVPLMGYFLGIYIVTVASGILCTVIVMQVDVFGLNGRPLPDWARKWFLEKFGKWLLVFPSTEYGRPQNKTEPFEKLMIEKSTLHLTGQLSHNPDLITVYEKLSNELDIYTKAVLEKHKKKEYFNNVRKEWSQLSVVMDRICLIIFLTWSTVFTISVLCR